MTMRKVESEITEVEKLLRATYQIMSKQNDSCYVLNVLEQTSVWDGVTCDGNCLLEEIGYLLDGYGVDKGYVPFVEE